MCTAGTGRISLAATLLLLAFAVAANAQERSDGAVNVRLPREEPLLTSSGEALIIPLTLQVEPGQTYTEQISSPPGWRVVSRDSTFSATDRSTITRLITVSVPNQTEAGPYRLRYDVRSRTAPEMRDSLSISLEVPERKNLEIRVQNPPVFIVSGDTLNLDVQVENTGNAPTRGRIRYELPAGRLLEEPPAFEVQPGQSVARSVPIRVDLDDSDEISHEFGILAVGDADTLATTRFSTSVYPTGRAGRGPQMHRFPTQIASSVNASSGQVGNRLGSYLSLSGNGQLEEGAATYVAFDVQLARSFFSTSDLGLRNRYRASVDHPRLRVEAGDQGFAMTNLAQATGDFGLGVEAPFGSATARAFAATDRFRADSRHAGGQISYGLDAESQQEIILSGLSRDGRIRGHLVSAGIDVRPFSELDVYAEQAISAGPDGGGMATDVTGRLRGDLGSLHGSYVRIADTYPRFGPEQRWVSGSGSILTDRFLSFSSSSSLSRFGDRRRGRLSASVRFGDYLELGYEQYRRASLASTIWDAPYREDGINAEVGISTENIRLQTRARLRSIGTENGSTAGTRPLNQDYRMSASYRGSDRFDLRVTGSYRRSDNPDFGQRSRLAGDVRGRLHFSEATSLRLDASVSRTRSPVSDLTTRFYHVRGDIEHEFSDSGHSISVSGQIGGGSLDILESGVGLRYELPLNVPIHRSRETGAVTGRLVDGETGEGLKNVPVRLGGSAVLTDANGEFAFYRRTPGTYQVSVNSNQLGRYRQMSSPPRAVRVEGGRKTEVTLRAVATANVEGIVQVRRPAGLRDTSTVVQGLEKVGVDLIVEDSTRTQFTTRGGSFRFTDVGPGTHSVRLRGETLPPGIRADSLEKQISVARSRSDSVAFTLREERREMTMLTPSTESDETDDPTAGPPSGGNRPDEASPAPGESDRPEPGQSDETASFSVQVGAFRDPANARALRDRLRSENLGEARIRPTTLEEEELYAVRVGRFSTRSSAREAVAARFSDYDGDAFVTRTSDPEEGPTLTIQLASFADRANAHRLRATVDEAGYSARIRQSEVDGRIVYRVRSGRFHSKEDARPVLEELQELAPSALIVRSSM